jgi:Flp pilus assembly protein TadG
MRAFEEPTVSNSRVFAPSVGSRRRCRRGDESGAALVEFALVVGLFMFILYGLIWFGMMLALKQGVTNAASEGARSAVGLTGAAATTKAQQTVAQRLSWLGSKYSASDVTVGAPAPCVGGSGTCITVKIAYPWDSKPLLPKAPGLGFVNVDKIASEATVQIS